MCSVCHIFYLPLSHFAYFFQKLVFSFTHRLDLTVFISNYCTDIFPKNLQAPPHKIQMVDPLCSLVFIQKCIRRLKKWGYCNSSLLFTNKMYALCHNITQNQCFIYILPYQCSTLKSCMFEKKINWVILVYNGSYLKWTTFVPDISLSGALPWPASPSNFTSWPGQITND